MANFDYIESVSTWCFILHNVKEHATLSAGARVDHGVDVEVTKGHVNRAADRGCVSRLVLRSFLNEPEVTDKLIGVSELLHTQLLGNNLPNDLAHFITGPALFLSHIVRHS